MPARFRVAFSFAEDQRIRVEAIAISLAAWLSREEILFYPWYAGEFNQADLDVILKRLYYEESEAIAVFFSAQYHASGWCRRESRAWRARLLENKEDSVMFFRLDDSDIEGVYSIDGVQDIRKRSNEEVAQLIVQRVNARGGGSTCADTHAVALQARRSSSIDKNEPYLEPSKALRAMLLPNEEFISEIAGRLLFRASNERRCDPIFSQGHGVVICTNERILARCTWLFIKTTVVFDLASIEQIAIERAFTEEMIITERKAGITRSIRITGEVYGSREAFLFALKSLLQEKGIAGWNWGA